MPGVREEGDGDVMRRHYQRRYNPIKTEADLRAEYDRLGYFMAQNEPTISLAGLFRPQIALGTRFHELLPLCPGCVIQVAPTCTIKATAGRLKACRNCPRRNRGSQYRVTTWPDDYADYAAAFGITGHSI